MSINPINDSIDDVREFIMEKDALSTVHDMGQESLSPDKFSMLLGIIDDICEERNLNGMFIDW